MRGAILPGHHDLSQTFSASAYRHSIAGCLDGAIGEHGLSLDELTLWIERLAPALDALQGDYRERRLPLLHRSKTRRTSLRPRPRSPNSAPARAPSSSSARAASSLGGQTLAQLGGWNIPGLADEAQRNRPRTRFYDNLDPVTLESALGTFDLDTARFIVTSKSGGTPETLAQTLAAMSALRAAGLDARIPALFLGITEPRVAGKANGLRDLFEGLGIPVLEHNPGIGGRFSGLTNVGLLPALARGLDVRAVRAGARSVVDAMMAVDSPLAFPPAVGAAVAVALTRERGIRTHVMMPYTDRLGRFSHWFVQLWAESLGKDGQGTAPIACVGPLDQHSQLQLFMDGPHEHLISIVRLPTSGIGPKLPADLAAKAGVGYLAGKAVGDLVAAQSHAVPEALGRAGRPVRTFDLDRLDEASLGALMMHCMLETILAARLMGVDPFDQPAVELAKVITRERVAKG